MTLQQAQTAFELAQNFDISLENVDIDHLYGFGLADFKPVHTTIQAVARMMRWQGAMMNGNWDMEAIDEVCQLGRSRFLILG